MQSKEYYIEQRNQHTPDKIRVIFLLESPPRSGAFFYNPDGKISEPLFSAMMEFLEHSPKNKEEGLSEFKRRGYLIIDSTYNPVNDIEDKVIKNRKILEGVFGMIKDIDQNIKNTPRIILVKSNIYQMYNGLLCAVGHKTINTCSIPFPLHKWRGVFIDELKKLKIKYKLP